MHAWRVLHEQSRRREWSAPEGGAEVICLRCAGSTCGSPVSKVMSIAGFPRCMVSRETAREASAVDQGQPSACLPGASRSKRALAIAPLQRAVERSSACGVRAPPVGVLPVEGDEDRGLPLDAWFHVKHARTSVLPSASQGRRRVMSSDDRAPSVVRRGMDQCATARCRVARTDDLSRYPSRATLVGTCRCAH